MNRLAIVVRQSPDWKKLNRESYREHSRRFCEGALVPTEMMNDFVDEWEKLFTVSFFETRQRMKEIAQENLGRVKNAVITDYQGFHPDLASTFLFVDDDDWFHPEIADHLSFNDCDGIVWTHGFFCCLEDKLIKQRDVPVNGYLCCTNNYAVPREFFKTHHVDSVYQHGSADPLFKSGQIRVKRIMPTLSFSNKHLGSTAMVYPRIETIKKEGGMLEYFCQGLQKLSTLKDFVPSGIEWALPSMRAVKAHYESVWRSASSTAIL